ncbi:TPA: hypothetical protein ACS62G_004195 [Klebsiella oxytoca]
MKKLLIDTLNKILYYALLAALAFGSATGQSNVLNVAAAAFWVVVFLGVAVGVLTIFLAHGAEHVTDEKTRQSVLESLRKIVRRKNVIARYWGGGLHGGNHRSSCLRRLGIHRSVLRAFISVCAVLHFSGPRQSRKKDGRSCSLIAFQTEV